MKETWPKYVDFEGDYKCCLHRSKAAGRYAHYWRDAGAWKIRVRQDEGQLITDDPKFPNQGLIGLKLKECTEEEWREDNKPYINFDQSTIV